MPKNPHLYHPKLPPSSSSSSRSYTVTQAETPAMLNDDETDICPVCEYQCTCNKTSPSPSTNNVSEPFTAQTIPAAAAPTPAVRKIKLTLSQSLTVTPTPTNQGSLAGDASVGPASEYDLPIPTPTRPPPKRRGRPPKASTQLSRESITPRNSRSEAPSAPRARAPRVSKTPNQPRNAARRLPNSSKNGDSNFIFLGSRHASVPESEPDEAEGAASDVFPTFLSASALSSSDDEDSDATNSVLDPGDESSLEAEEERHIIAEEALLAKEKARVRREIMGENENPHRKWDRYNWQIIPRKKKSIAGSSDGAVDLDSDSDVDSDEDDEDGEEAAEDEPEPDGLSQPEVTIIQKQSWDSESENDDFDAAVFFANLDSDNEDHRGNSGDDTSSELGAQSLDESAQAGLLQRSHSLDSLPIVTQDVNGQLVFTSDLRDAALGLHLDAPFAFSDLTERDPMQVDSDTMDEDVPEEDEEWAEEFYSDDGNTTDDMMNDELIPTVQALSFRAPTPPIASINPLSTVQSARRRRKHRGGSPAPSHSPNPSDILSRRRSTSLARSLSDSVSGETRSPSISGSFLLKPPPMGTFDSSSSAGIKIFVIDGSKTDIPSPFPRIKRSRPAHLKSKGQGSQGDSAGLRHTRHMATSNNVLFDVEEVEIAMDSGMSQPIDIDDVLDSALLEDDQDAPPSAVSASEDDMGFNSYRHLKNLTRWDRVPMNTFRKTRYASSVPDVGLALALPLHGFSYGAPMGGALKSPSASTWWDAGTTTKKSRKQNSRPNMSLTISPVIFPVRDGERTPPSTPAAGRHLNISPLSVGKLHKDKERRKKKTTSDPSMKPTKRSHQQRPSNLFSVPPLRI